jgi:hypothetical protein
VLHEVNQSVSQSVKSYEKKYGVHTEKQLMPEPGVTEVKKSIGHCVLANDFIMA